MISIIIPIYKAECYLRKCLNSIQEQTFTDWETILVDDGSPDGSGKICDDYAREDSRFKSVHKKNGGVSDARQTGLDYATGEYVIHIDPDDWIEPNMLEGLYEKAKSEDADMVICDFLEDTAKTSKLIRQKPSDLDHKVVFRELFDFLHGSCCNKLIKRDCFYKYNIHFPKGYVLLEDLYVIASLCRYDIKISYLPKAYYHYVQDVNANSMVRKPSRASVMSVADFTETFAPVWQEMGVEELQDKYKYLTKLRARNSGLYSRKEVRNIFSEINAKLKSDVFPCLFQNQEKTGLVLDMYFPSFISRIYNLTAYTIHKLCNVWKS